MRHHDWWSLRRPRMLPNTYHPSTPQSRTLQPGHQVASAPLTAGESSTHFQHRQSMATNSVTSAKCGSNESSPTTYHAAKFAEPSSHPASFTSHHHISPPHFYHHHLFLPICHENELRHGGTIHSGAAFNPRSQAGRGVVLSACAAFWERVQSQGRRRHHPCPPHPQARRPSSRPGRPRSRRGRERR